MTISRTPNSISRRTAITGLSAGGLALGLAAAVREASAQESTPVVMADHPLVGTWIVVRDIRDTTVPPSIVVYSADGGLIDPSQNVAGSWRATGPRSAEWTLIVFLKEDPTGYIVVRSAGEVDESGDALNPTVSFTVVSADGTVLTSGQGESRYTRFPIEPESAGGTALTGFPTWTPAIATPTT